MKKTPAMILIALGLLVNGNAQQVPGILNYQGRVAVNGTNFDGTGEFLFALVDGGTDISCQAAGVAHRTGQFVTSVDVTEGGAGYVTPPSISFTGGSGSGATAHSLIGDGVVTSIVVDSAGSGYVSDPEVVVSAPPVSMSYRTFWSNGASSVSLPVTKGLYSVLLGDETIPNMDGPIPASIFAESDVRLRVWFNDGVNGWALLAPDQRIAPVGYAQVAAGVAAGAVLPNGNTFYISASAPAGGDGSIGRPWNTLYGLTNAAGGGLNGKTVLIFPGQYYTGTDIVFNATCRDLTIKGLDQRNVRILSTNNECRIFTMIGVTNVVLENMTLTSTNTLNVHGGAVLMSEGVMVRNCTFRGNNGYEGASICCEYGGTVRNCDFMFNSGRFDGGVYCYYGGTVENCTFTSNNMSDAAGGVGCYYGGTVRDCVFTGNSGWAGGSMQLYYGGQVRDCVFNDNVGENGGGIFIYAGGTVDSCVFAGNVAKSQGGAIYQCSVGNPTIANCDIIRGTGSVNSVVSLYDATWRCVWTSDTSAAGFVVYTNRLNN